MKGNRGAKNSFRRRLAKAAAEGTDLGREIDLVSSLRESFPSVNSSTLRQYVQWAKQRKIPGCHSLIEDSQGRLRTGPLVGNLPILAESEETPESGSEELLNRIARLEERVQGINPQPISEELLNRIARLEERVQGINPQPMEITIKETKASGKVEVRKVKGPLPKVFGRLLQLASIRQNVLMVGPSGSGKTYLAGKVAEELKLPFSFVSCSAGMSEGQLAGRLLPVEAGGRFAYVPAPFVERYEDGGLFLFDEIDSSDANTLTFVNAAIANGHLSLPHRPKKPVATRHKDFICFAAANTFGHGANRIYAGRNQLDGATLDRFRAGMVLIDYDPVVEETLCDMEVLNWGRPIREAIERLGLRRIMSTRVLRDFSIQKRELGWGPQEWEESYFADWSADDRARIKGSN